MLKRTKRIEMKISAELFPLRTVSRRQGEMLRCLALLSSKRERERKV